MPVKFSDLALTPDDATELYRKVGRALWAFTFLEYIIAYRITLILSDSPAIQNDVHSCLQKHFKLTLGALLQKLRETCAIPSDLDLKLSQHHINRNWLYHRLYLEGHPCLYNRQKFQALFIKLDAMKNLAHELTVIFDGLMYQWLILKGISQEVLYQETRRQIDSLKIQHDPFAR
jgi:hypothetical protein